MKMVAEARVVQPVKDAWSARSLERQEAPSLEPPGVLAPHRPEP